MSATGGAGVRDCFSAAAEGFVVVVAALGRDDWGRPGLGEWTVRDLVGHTSRALSTIEAYLGQPSTEVEIRDPLDYLLAVRGPSVDPSAIAQRGRQAGAALGDNPLAAVQELATRVTALVAATPDDATLTVANGRGATLLAYLPTRTLELTVHTLDLVGALGLGPPASLAAPVAACLELAGRAMGRGSDAPALLLALTGRRALPEGFSII